jgi:hypothetical protein
MAIILRPDDEIVDVRRKGISRGYDENGQAEIHTSDRVSFLRCRRRWDLSSPLRRNLSLDGAANPYLWLGTGFHFALEDYHGYNRFTRPDVALRAFSEAWRPSDPRHDKRPDDWQELIDLGCEMFSYYTQYWLPRRREFETFWVNGVPQVEVEFKIPIPGTDANYVGKFDRVVVDPYGRLWVQDYKTAAQFDTNKLETDPQVSTYVWAAMHLYPEYQTEGMLYTQFLKSPPKEPRVLANGELSLDKSQRTTYSLYRKAVKDRNDGKIPRKYREILETLKAQETPEGDRFIIQNLVRRNEHAALAEVSKIAAQTIDMLNPELPLYPNPTRDCIWDCSFRSVCLAMDDGSDYQYMLESEFVTRNEEDPWRSRIKWPDQEPMEQVEELLPLL